MPVCGRCDPFRCSVHPHARMHIAVRRRLRLPLPITGRRTRPRRRHPHCTCACPLPCIIPPAGTANSLTASSTPDWLLGNHAKALLCPSTDACLAMRGGSGESARTSLRRGASPSTLAMPDSGKESRLDAQDQAAESAGHRRRTQMGSLPAWQRAARARLRASSRTNSAAPGDHRPPTSMRRATKRFDGFEKVRVKKKRHRLPCASSG